MSKEKKDYYYLIDNGEDYSDHAIYFIKSKSASLVDFLRTLKKNKAIGWYGEGYSIIGRWSSPPDFWKGGWIKFSQIGVQIHSVYFDKIKKTEEEEIDKEFPENWRETYSRWVDVILGRD